MSNQKSYNQLIAYLQEFSTNHLQIKGFGSGFRFNLNEAISLSENFPLIYVEPKSHRFVNWTQLYSIRIYSLDIKQKDSSNEQDVLSDTLQILNDLIKYVKNDIYNEWNVLNQPTSIPVTNYGTEFTAGWYIDIDVEATVNDDDCDIPMLPITSSGSTSCDDATITNSNNTYTINVASGGTYILEDTTYNVYINGSLRLTTIQPSMIDLTINIT